MAADPHFRPALPADCPAMSRVLIESITQLCRADHQDRTDVLEGWLRNKSEEGVRAMLADEGNALFVVEVAGEIAGVGAIRPAEGSVRLNYVAPRFRFRGVSRALMRGMEDALRQRGLQAATLNSSTTAHRFYQDAGWIDLGEPIIGQTMTVFPMRKAL